MVGDGGDGEPQAGRRRGAGRRAATTVPRPGPPTNAAVPAGMEDVEQGSWVQRRGAHRRRCGEQPERITPAAGIGGVGGVGLGI